MKKSIICFVIFSSLLLISCKENPKDALVISKDNDTFYKALEQDEIANFDAGTAPEKWEDRYEKYNGRLTIDINADIIIEEVDMYPVIKIKPYYIPIEQANKIIESIFGDNDVYFNIYPLTKGQIEELLILVKADYQMAINDRDEELAEEYENTLNDLMLMYEDAPEKAEIKLYDGEFEVFRDGDYEEIALRLDPTDKETPILEIRNLRNSEYSNGFDSEVAYYDPNRQMYNYNDSNGNYLHYSENPTYSTNEAIKAINTAKDFINSIDIYDAEVVNIQALCGTGNRNGILSYKIYFSKTVNDIAIPLFIQMGGSRSESEEYTRPFVAETLIVEVENEEIVYFEWRNIYEVDVTMNEGVELLSFKEIMNNVENQLAAKFAFVDEQKYQYSLYVDKIMLTYAVEPVKDSKYEYMLVPVWAFYGGYDYGSGCELEDGTILKGKYKEVASLLTINAVDGTLIIGR